MSAEFSDELRAELLDDFYAEADEYLSQIRTHLAQLEGGSTPVTPAILESIFRNTHTFKGIAAMAGLVAAEQVAHAGEDFLRRLLDGSLALGPEGVNALVAMTQRLEQIVTAHRQRKPIPAETELLPRLAALSSRAAGAAATETRSRTAPQTPTPETPSTWHCTFSPSRDLDRRGVNITSVRARLGEIGTIVSATPQVKAGGAITFEFVVALREPPADQAKWDADGLVFRPAASAAPSPAPAPETGLFITPSHIVRVDLSRLDELMRITGELVIHRSRLDERINQDARNASGLREVNAALGRSLRDLRTAITRVRLVPIAEIFTRMPFVVRDLARESGKEVQLVLEGQHTEIDKYLVERLKEPLLHLVRNALSHGIETSAERVAAGKPAQAKILLRAEAAGETALIRVRDDGRGIEAAAVARRAADLGLAVPVQLDSEELLNVLCQPGFSTRTEADRGAGRGVGMTVVRNTLRELGGAFTLETMPGRGTEFTLRLPLTLSIVEMLIAAVGAQNCAVPQGSVAEIVQISDADVRTIKETEVVPYRGGLLPLVRLRNVFGGGAVARPQLPVLVIHSERGRAGLVVDRVHAQREVVVRPLRDPLLQVPGITGATELGDGRPVLILDAVALTQRVVRPHDLAPEENANPLAPANP